MANSSEKLSDGTRKLIALIKSYSETKIDLFKFFDKVVSNKVALGEKIIIEKGY